ncbi:MAG: hypothetical protein AAGA87_02185 [Pseudomonadota bacterium]
MSKRLPPLAPPEVQPAPDPAPEPTFSFSLGSLGEESTSFRDRTESHDAYARLTVYALTTIVLIFAFPVGFALLLFNILGGENLRTTSHALALTGLGLALFLPGIF